MRAGLLVIAIALQGCASGAAPEPLATGTLPAGERVRVERVVDGDTIIVVRRGERIRVRLIGVDAPESVKPGAPIDCFGPESSEALHDLLDRREVVLVGDVEPLDRFGRTLAYVYRVPDGLFVQHELVARGYATVLTIRPNVRHVATLERAERGARARGEGLWRACA